LAVGNGVPRSSGEAHERLFTSYAAACVRLPWRRPSLARELPDQWVNAANLTLLGALRRWAPQAIDWSAMGDIVPVLDAFEAHMAAKTTRRH
jgi:hypothetical protein